MSASENWLGARARTMPEHRALECGDVKWSYRELRKQVLPLAESLRERGVGPGTAVASLLDNGVAPVALLHAIDHLGAVFVPLNTRLSPGELDHPLRDSGTHLLVCSPGPLMEAALGVRSRLPDLALAEMRSTELQEVHPGRSRAPEPIYRGDARVLIYTSGTSGRPRGALLTRENFEASALGSAIHLGSQADDRWLACMPLFHVGGLSILTRCVLAGSAVVVHERFDSEAVCWSLEHDDIQFVSLAPTMLQRVLDAWGQRPAPPALRCALIGGGPAPLSLLERAHALGFPIAPTYGLTEATSQVATRWPDQRDSPLDAGLVPLPSTTVRVLDDAGRLCDRGRGEILVRGPTVMHGYITLSSGDDALRDGWLHTGDIGELDDQGRLRVLDRRSDLIVSGGENVYPAEIETVLALHPGVAEAGVAGVEDTEFGWRPAAWIVPHGTAPTTEELEHHCRQSLAGYKIPVAFTPVESLPRNASGKLLRRELRRRETSDPQR
ncbi:o-succinylbenzoate--CoA ligase [Myxococcota bacterium]|nr:o-succinylbenzoate--CoA ligase [Myxococcota bacterium]